jgi:uridine kinase
MNKPKGITIKIEGSTGTGRTTLANWIYKNIIKNGNTAIIINEIDGYYNAKNKIEHLKTQYDVIIIDGNKFLEE